MFLYILGAVLLFSGVVLFNTYVKNKDNKKKKKGKGSHEPLAIVGIGCKLPVGGNVKNFWEGILDGVDGVKEIPESRWKNSQWFDHQVNRRGKINVKKGGFVEGLEYFDANFFNISPKEAVRMDPQHRMLLECTYQAFEDSGIPVKSVSGKDVGVFVGIASHDYGDLQFQVSERDNITGQTITGGSNSIASNRISYYFNLKGPSASYDTACSSSVVALNSAMQNLRSGDCSMAIVGGVSALIRPETTLSFSKGGFLSTGGICKSFDANADGYIRSEGCGVIIIKPLSQALKDGDKIYSTILTSGLNQDGKTNGISMPNQDSQQKLINKCLKKIGLPPNKMQYIEAHGTGTKIGDPIETNAVGKELCQKREETLYVGSVKSNVGHLEAASAMAGMVKLSLAMKNKIIPKNINFHTPNPKIPFEKYKIKIPTENVRWDGDNNGDRFGALNSFGFGGTNGHVILRMNDKYLNTKGKNTEFVNVGGKKIFFLTAKSQDALREYAKLYVDFLKEQNSPSLDDICYTLMKRRSHFRHRLNIICEKKEDLIEKLQNYSEKKANKHVIYNKVLNETDKLAFVFAGQGPQNYKMGRELYKANDVFKKFMDEIDQHFQKYSDWSIVKELTQSTPETTKINRTEYAQPSIFAIQVSIFEMYKSFGIHPAAIVGHSIGEVAAAYASGHLSLENAVKVIYNRSKTQQKAEHKGGMLATGLTMQEAEEILEKGNFKEHVCVAAHNGPKSTVLSGDTKELKEINEILEKKGAFARFLKVSVPFHSHHMQPLKDELITSLKNLETKKIQVPLYSTVKGGFVMNLKYDEHYWYKNCRQSVLFNDCIEEMVQDGYTTFLEISPHLILARGIKTVLSNFNLKGISINTLMRDQPEVLTILRSVSTVMGVGYNFNLDKICPNGKMVDLPFYPFQKKYYWLESQTSIDNRLGKRIHPYIVERVKNEDSYVFKVNLDTRKHNWLDDHRVQGPIIFPGAGFSELIISCSLPTFKEFYVQDISFHKALYLPDEDLPNTPNIQLNMKENGEFEIKSKKQTETDEEWSSHVKGKINFLDKYVLDKTPDLESLKLRLTDTVNREDLYKALYDRGLMLGSSFQIIRDLWRNKSTGECLSVIRPDDKIVDDYDEHNIHPTVLDACFQTLFAYETDTDNIGVYVPIRIDKIKFYQKPSKEVWTYGILSEYSKHVMKGELYIFNGENGKLAVRINGFTCRYIDGTKDSDIDISTCLYKYIWEKDDVETQDLSFKSSEKYLVRPSSIKDDLEEILEEVRQRESQITYYRDFIPAVNDLWFMYLVNALKKIGLKFKNGDVYNVQEIAKKSRVIPAFHKLFLQIFKTLNIYGYCEKVSEGVYKVIKELNNSHEHEKLAKECLEKYDFVYETRLYKKCGEKLKESLLGEINPVELLFPREDWQSIVDYYTKSFSFKKYSQIIARAIETIFKKIPKTQKKKIRILEIGAGTGGVTSFILPKIKKFEDIVEYTFTDLSQVFLAKAKEAFSDYVNFMKFEICDVCKIDHLSKNSYDIIIASDVIHATQDVRESIGNIKSLLGSGGIFVMLELTKPPIYVDYTFGLTKEWWHFKDTDIRPEHPYMLKETWNEKVFRKLGFADVFSCSPEVGEQEGQEVFIIGNEIFDDPNPKKEVVKKEKETWVIFQGENKEVSEMVEKKFSEEGHEVYFVRKGGDYSKNGNIYTVDQTKKDQIIKIYEELKPSGCIYLWELDRMPTKEIHSSNYEKEMISNFDILSVCNPVFAIDEFKPKFYIVTAGTKFMKKDPKLMNNISMAQTSVWGLGRTLLHENPTFFMTFVDLSTPDMNNSLEKEIGMLYKETRLDFNDQEIAFRGKERYVHRLVNYTREQDIEDHTEKVKINDKLIHVDMKSKGSLENVILCEKKRIEELSENEVEIKTVASSLNFKDLMIATNLIHPDALKRGYTGDAYGMEVSGIITRVGKNVSDFSVGDEVFAIASDTLSTLVVTNSEFVFKKPESLNHKEAACVLFPYLTAYYSLVTAGRVEKGEKVLIHSATGGVGVAAINICKKLGCEVLVTCNKASQEKIDFLKQLGIDESRIFNSRTLTFAKEIIEKFGKVNVVLNSLAGKDAIYKNLEVLDDYGRMVELGKADIYGNTFMGMRPFGNNVSFHGVDIDKLLTHKPALCSRLCKEFINDIILKGEYEKHPFKTFKFSQVKEAFFFMAATKHIGKIVIDFDEKEEIKVLPKRKVNVDQEGAIVISGGTGGFCFKRIVKFLINKGAKNFALFSRSGVKEETVKKDIEKYEKSGIKIKTYAVDVTSGKEMKEMFVDIRKNFKKIKGVVHGAMVLKDTMTSNMTIDDFMMVLKPKIIGCLHLHELTLEDKLDFFILMSSLASVYGTVGQGNYAAANSFLDHFSYYRRSMGLASTTINWGVIGGVGYVAKNDKVANTLKLQGWLPFNRYHVEEILSHALVIPTAELVSLRGDWVVLNKFFMTDKKTKRFGHLLIDEESDKKKESKSGMNFVFSEDFAKRYTVEEQKKMIEKELVAQLCFVSGLKAGEFDKDESIVSYGFDSLMTNQMRNWIKVNFGFDYPLMKFMKGVSTNQLTEEIYRNVSQQVLVTMEKQKKE